MSLRFVDKSIVDITVEYNALLSLIDDFYIGIASPFTLSTADTLTSLAPSGSDPLRSLGGGRPRGLPGRHTNT